MDGKIIIGLIIVLLFLAALVVIIRVLRSKDKVSGEVKVHGLGTLRAQSSNNQRDATIRDADARNIKADAPQGSATIEKARATDDISATAGGIRDPKV